MHASGSEGDKDVIAFGIVLEIEGENVVSDMERKVTKTGLFLKPLLVGLDFLLAVHGLPFLSLKPILALGSSSLVIQLLQGAIGLL